MSGLFYKPVILGMEHGFTYRPDEFTTVDEWMDREIEITKTDCTEFPNAAKAWKIKNSKLYKVMK